MPKYMAEAHSTKDLGCELRTVVTDKSFGKPEMLENGLYCSVSKVALRSGSLQTNFENESTHNIKTA